MRVVIYIFEDFTPLEVFGPYNLLSKFPDTEVLLVAEKPGIINADNKNISLNIQHSIKDITSADVLLIPGSAVGWTQEIRNRAVLNWIRRINITTQYTSATCSGSIILAASGVLRGKTATVFWRAKELLDDYNVKYVNQPVVKDGKYLTAEGVSASMDMAMQIGRLLHGDRNAKVTQLLLAYESKQSTSLPELFNDEDLVDTASKTLIKDARETLSIWSKILNVKLLLRLKGDD